MKKKLSILQEMLRRYRVPARKNKDNEVHHLIPSSRKKGFYTEDPRNKRKIRRTLHTHLHGLFDNTTPQGVLILYCEMYKTVLSEEAKKLLKEAMTMNESEFYERGLLK